MPTALYFGADVAIKSVGIASAFGPAFTDHVHNLKIDTYDMRHVDLKRSDFITGCGILTSQRKSPFMFDGPLSSISITGQVVICP